MSQPLLFLARPVATLFRLALAEEQGMPRGGLLQLLPGFQQA